MGWKTKDGLPLTEALSNHVYKEIEEVQFDRGITLEWQFHPCQVNKRPAIKDMILCFKWPI